MADKQATVYIIDRGLTMRSKNCGRDETDLDFGMRYVWEKIATTMSAARKTFTLGVLGLRTDESENQLDTEEEYHHICVMQPIGPMEMPQLRKLKEQVKASRTSNGDAVSAIVVAIDMIETYTRKLKYFRKIVLVTDGKGPMNSGDIDMIAEKISQDEIELVVIGIDFDDAEFGFKEENKDLLKGENEALLKSLTEKCPNSTFGTAAEAVLSLTIPVVKTARPYKCFAGQLTLGDPSKYDTAICIDVERYFKTKVAKPVSASSFIVATEIQGTAGSTQSSHTIRGESGHADESDLSAVRNAQTYRVADESAPGGKKDVDREDLAKGYMYGKTAVHISEADENITKLETLKSFEILGFIPSENYIHYMSMEESCITIAQQMNDKARMGLSSIIRALHELESYAVARIVMKGGKDPQLLILAPLIELELEALIDVPIPFAEDVRTYKFPPLDRVITSSGTTLKKHRNLPGEDLMAAMDKYVDSMDLANFDRDDEGAPTEYIKIEDSFSPVLHRINQAIRQRATQSSQGVEPPAPALIKFAIPPEELVNVSRKQLKALIVAADIKKVPPTAKGKRKRDVVKPLSGLDVDSLLGREKRAKISAQNAVPEFKQLLSLAEDLKSIENATMQMGAIVESDIAHSVGSSGYDRAIEALGVMKEELIALEEPDIYNSFLRGLKEKIVAEKLGGDRRDIWFEIRRTKLGLIDKNQSEISNITEQEAVNFYSLKSDLTHRTKQ